MLPGHGEGHNSGQAVNVVAAIVVKNLMTRDKIPGTIMLFPGIAEEQMAGKAFLVRDGVFKNTDVTLFTHVSSDLGVSWGAGGQSALISAEFRFKGSSAHAAGAPWRGQSALDAVMLMGSGWEFKREHLRLQQRSHYVIKDGERPAERRAEHGEHLVLFPVNRIIRARWHCLKPARRSPKARR